MRQIYCVIMLLSFLVPARGTAQSFDSHPVPFNPSNEIAFKMNLPITHLDINNYVPSTRGVYAGRSATFKFYNRDYPWTELNLFMRIRWDSDLDASNGVTWSDWFQDQNENAYATVTKTFTKSGIYTITFEIELYTSDGTQSYKRQKQYDITVVPMPASMYTDGQGDQLFYWAGSDGALDKPVLVVEGFDPDNSDTPAINYGLGYDLIETARSQGYDVFIMEWVDGGADMTKNRDVFLGACQLLHRLLGTTEAAIQVVGVSMGGVVSRDGLAYAEDNLFAHPGQYLEHYVNTFVSFDAPQQGGHMNTRLQSVFKDNGSSTQQITLQSMAAKQLLYEDVYDETYSIHNDFYRALRSLHNDEQPFGVTNGYPRRCMNFTLSNGNRAADYPGLTTRDELASVYEYSNVNILSIMTFPAITHTEHILAQNRDLWPGSTFPHDLRTLATSGFKDFLSFGPGGVFLLAGGGGGFNVNFNPAYTPTESALDLESYARAADGSLAGGKSWFDDTLTQLSVRRHDELSPESETKVMGWLNGYCRYPYLGRPSNVRATFTGGKSVQIYFNDEAAFENGFKVERKTEGGSYAEVASLGPNQTQFLDADPSLQLFKNYTYRIRSFAGGRYSAYSGEISINLQPHLQSSTSLATSSNGQHKIVQTISPSGGTDLYMVYESGGNAFLTHYFPPTSSWDNEQPIGGAPQASIVVRHPSFVLDSLGGTPYVVYERVDAAATSHTVRFDGYDKNSGVFFPMLTLSSFTGDTSIHATPVAAVSKAQSGIPSYLAACWRNGTSLAFGIGVYDSKGMAPGYSWSTVDLSTIIASQFAKAANPAIAIDALGPASKPVPNFYVVWEEPGTGGGIRMIHGSYTGSAWPPSAAQVTWEGGQVFHVGDNTATDIHSNPSIALDASGNVFIAWQYRGAAGGSIRVQSRNGYTSAVVLTNVNFAPGGSSSPSSPSISDYRYTSTKPSDLTLIWSASNGLAVSQFLNGSWSAPYVVASIGSNPNIECTFSASDVYRMMVFTGATGPPYSIGTTTIPSPPPAPSGCPYVFGWNGSDFEEDNNILPQSEYGGNEGRVVTDYYKLRFPPRTESGRYILRLREFEEEESRFDDIKLIAVDHADSAEIAVLPDNRIIQYSVLQSTPLDFMKGMDGKGIRASRGDSITLSFSRNSPRSAHIKGRATVGLLLGGRLIHDGGTLKARSIKPQSVGNISAGRNLSIPATSFTFRERTSFVYLPLDTIEDDLTIHFVSPAELDFAALAEEDTTPIIITELAAQFHSGINDINATALGPGETLELHFPLPPLPGKMHRSFILETKGRYDLATARVHGKHPQSFALAQNFPNPFNSQTALKYSLAAPSHAVVAIYNVLGVEIARLVDRDQEPGAYDLTWDAGESPSGVYCVRMTARDGAGRVLYDETRKLLLLK